MKIKFVNEKALAPMLRPVSWREDRAPHRSGVFMAQILQATPQSQSAGPSLAPITADQWIVRLPPASAANPLAAYIRAGDSLTAESFALTVQTVTPTLDGFLQLVCTAAARAPIS